MNDKRRLKITLQELQKARTHLTISSKLMRDARLNDAAKRIEWATQDVSDSIETVKVAKRRLKAS